MGLTPRRAVITLYGVATVFIALALASAMGPANVIWAVAAVFLLILWAGIRALGYWEVTEFQKSFVTRLVAGLRASGDAALRGLEHDLSRIDSLYHGWNRVCETAWELGITEMHLTPVHGWEEACPEFHRFAPPVTGPAAFLDPPAVAVATWSIDVEVNGEVVAEVVARRPLVRVDFDPERLVVLVRGLVLRHLEAHPRVISRQERPVAS
jgi:hypothetical protein